jgi:phage-related protein
MGSSLKDLREMSDDLREDIGQNLGLIQAGFPPKDFKPMPSVGLGVYEIRAKAKDNIARCFYVTKFNDIVVVLHCFIKKTQKTSARDIEVGKSRYHELKGKFK